MRLTVHDIIEATDATLVRTSETIAERLCTDTRILRAGDLFVALSGDNFDGNLFVREALERGAAGVICSREAARNALAGTGFVFATRDAVSTLGQVGLACRRHAKASVVTITGSAGKTTTKELSAHLCRGSLPVFATEGNKNNHIGLPLMLSRIDAGHAAAILEIGMNHSGEIAYLTRLAEPNIGLLTNIGDAHLGNFPDRESLIAAKAELFETMEAGSIAILNADCPNTRTIRHEVIERHETILFGESEVAQVRAMNIQPCQPFGWKFDLIVNGHATRAFLPVFGRYQVHNALAAACVAFELGVPLEAVVERFATFEPPQLRSHIQTVEGVRVVEDCYNSSPSAMKSALASFAETGGAGRKFVLLGDMNELGNFAESCHRAVGLAAARAHLDGVVCVGPLARWIAEEAAAHGAVAQHFDKLEEAVEFLAPLVHVHDAILVKGSRIAKLERALGLLREAFAHHAPKGATA